MRKLLLFVAAMLISWAAFPQAIAYFDNFESYTAGQYLAVQSDYWTTWSNLPGSSEDGYVSTEEALSGVNSVKVAGTTDLLKVIGDKVSGKWKVEVNMYVPTGFGGYYNLQKFSSPGVEWGVQAYFGEDGNGTIDAGAEGAGVFTFSHDTWINIVNIVDLDNDWAEVWIDGVQIVAWPWSLGTFGDPGAIQLGGMNMYAGAPSGDVSTYYFDDVKVEQLISSFYYDDFESYDVNSFIAVENPTWWTTWSNLPGSGEDGQIVETYASSPTKSVVLDEVPGASDLILKLGDKTSGAYEVNFDFYVETGKCGYFNIQHFESPGIEWAYEVYLRTNGTGKLYAGSTTAITFTYPKDTWFQVVNRINIDGDMAYLYVDGVLVHSWPFHYQGTSTSGTNQLGGVDFYAGAESGSGETPRAYFDNLEFKPIPAELYADDFESYNIGEFMAVVNPIWWTTWSNLPGSGEDGEIVDDYANSPTKSVVLDEVPGASDLILKLGDRISGSYALNWMAYVETGYAGYFNIQHFQSPGIEWAYEVYFDEDGTGRLFAGSTTPFTFDYPKDTWFSVENNINIDEDWVTLTIDGVIIYSWPFHFLSDGTAGTNQLGGVDFYAGAATGETPKSYFDDIEFLQISGELDPVIAVDPTSIAATAPAGGVDETTLNITNEGAADLEYQVSVIYEVAVQRTDVISLEGQSSPVRTLGYSEVSVDPDARPASYNPPPTDDFVLHYDGDNSNAIGWGSAPISPIVAAMFPTNLTLPHAGMKISTVDVYINDPGTNFVLKIYDMGTSYQPGTLLVSQPFAGQSLSWNTINLATPVNITGADIWVGYQFTQPDTGIYIPGVDAGPNDPNGDFISTGVGWSHLSNNPALPYNWNIRANLTGTPIEQWLSVAPASGLITPGNTDPLTVTCDASGLDVGTYTATLRVLSNDPENSQIDVPVTFEVTEGGTPVSVILDFEEQADWDMTFNLWSVVDVDGSSTFPIPDVTFPHSQEPMAFIAFNPATTTPPMTGDPEIQPHGGVRFGACMDAADPTFLNDDWMISPQITLGINSSITLWVKSYTGEYGLERYNVLVSTTDMDPASFTAISGSTPMEAPTVWTEVTFDLAAYDGQTVYVAIQCVSEDALAFMIDDVSIDFLVGMPEQSQDVEIAIYPNPVTDQLNITSGVEMTQVDIFNQLGQKVYSQVVKDTNFNMNTTGFNAGVYFVRITTDEGIATKKIMVK
ncbi:MAG: choice-of-anchor J domain-containing protein [Bacteroidales bacterium]|nr:choice-of-anchor J domain-containing protein [Bacteroidales bacterium]